MVLGREVQGAKTNPLSDRTVGDVRERPVESSLAAFILDGESDETAVRPTNATA